MLSKIGIVYESIIDQNRKVQDIINNVLHPIQSNLAGLSDILIFRSFYRWAGMAKNEPVNPVYDTLKEAILEIKKDLPNCTICGALALQEIWKEEYNPYTNSYIPEKEVWDNYALDPSIYGMNINKKDFQKMMYGNREGYIFPDIISPRYQKLLIDFAKVQINAGIDYIWIDGLFKQLTTFYKLTNDINHPACIECINAIKKIIDEIHAYNPILLGSWAMENLYLIGMKKSDYPDLDFLTLSPSASEVLSNNINSNEWNNKLSNISNIYGPIDIISFIDWGFTTDTPLGTFSQSLTPQQQENFLINMEKYMKTNNVLFAYPVHGGYMGDNALKLSTINSKKVNKYDALAPEFNTFSKILDLANKRIAVLNLGSNHSIPQIITKGVPSNFNIEINNTFNTTKSGYIDIEFRYPSGVSNYTSSYSFKSNNISFDPMTSKKYTIPVTIPVTYTKTGKHDVYCNLFSS